MTLTMFLMVLSLVLLLLAAIPGIPTRGVGLGWLGLFFWVLAQMLR